MIPAKFTLQDVERIEKDNDRSTWLKRSRPEMRRKPSVDPRLNQTSLNCLTGQLVHACCTTRGPLDPASYIPRTT